jgi:hypothetical protein
MRISEETLLDAATLVENQQVNLYCTECDYPGPERAVFSHRVALIYFFSPPEGGGFGLILAADEKGTLRDAKGRTVEVHSAS